jgi:hypothetical protein
MSDYVLEVHYGEGADPIRIALHGCTPEEAEVARQDLAQEIEHAVEIEAPMMYSDLATDIAIDPARVTRVDLVEP